MRKPLMCKIKKLLGIRHGRMASNFIGIIEKQQKILCVYVACPKCKTMTVVGHANSQPVIAGDYARAASIKSHYRESGWHMVGF